MKSNFALPLAAGALVSLGAALTPPPASAQSSDALLDKLVQKGILTVKEAGDLRKESDADFTRAYQAKSGMPDWVTCLKFSGDVRFRYEHIHFADPAAPDRDRFRFRLRAGVAAVLQDQFEVGFRLASGTAEGSPLTLNQTLENNGSKKPVLIDLAYARWTPLQREDWTISLTAGKMENPLSNPEVLFDLDYTPEGAVQQAFWNVSHEHALKFTLAEYVLDELAFSSADPYLFAAQLRWDSTWNRRLQTTLGVTALGIKNSQSLTGANVPDLNSGNTRTQTGTAGQPAYHFNPIAVDAGATWHFEQFPLYRGACPWRISGQFLKNPAAPEHDVGWGLVTALGKASKRGTWELAYRWRWLEGDCWYEELLDDDSAAYYAQASRRGQSGPHAGSNIRSHLVTFTYAVTDSLNLVVKYYHNAAIIPVPAGAPSTQDRVVIDALWRF